MFRTYCICSFSFLECGYHPDEWQIRPSRGDCFQVSPLDPYAKRSAVFDISIGVAIIPIVSTHLVYVKMYPKVGWAVAFHLPAVGT